MVYYNKKDDFEIFVILKRYLKHVQAYLSNSSGVIVLCISFDDFVYQYSGHFYAPVI
jgi:hypothetical protein